MLWRPSRDIFHKKRDETAAVFSGRLFLSEIMEKSLSFFYARRY
ncbi:hypothetical protein BAXH7_01146 [Bacillus amyloliquefaciens XH7]|nr:hypothetical protein BAXH7_01146 [Bacillus amyloliquefaciens XH7]KYC95764.1 hypothetical protein B425_2618 [Bacillus amyloliquefaciens]QBG56784.1 hypothetical protein D2M30_2455 [Bacillus amyloliquefaciens]